MFRAVRQRIRELLLPLALSVGLAGCVYPPYDYYPSSYVYPGYDYYGPYGWAYPGVVAGLGVGYFGFFGSHLGPYYGRSYGGLYGRGFYGRGFGPNYAAAGRGVYGPGFRDGGYARGFHDGGFGGYRGGGFRGGGFGGGGFHR